MSSPLTPCETFSLLFDLCANPPLSFLIQSSNNNKEAHGFLDFLTPTTMVDFESTRFNRHFQQI